MDNPLTDEQIKELNGIAKLDKEQQKIRLNSFLSTLNEEQLEFLQKNQQKECLFCSLVENKIKNYKIYEDEDFIVVLDIKAVNEGQCLIIPREHVVFSFNVDKRIWDVVNNVVTKLYQEFNCGTNIFIANGSEAGQMIGHFSVSIIPRFKDDKVRFSFIGNESDEEKLEELSQKLKIKEEVKKKEEIKEYKGEILEEDYDERIP
ncbi:MAG: HIT family protein [archaeon]